MSLLFRYRLILAEYWLRVQAIPGPSARDPSPTIVAVAGPGRPAPCPAFGGVRPNDPIEGDPMPGGRGNGGGTERHGSSAIGRAVPGRIIIVDRRPVVAAGRLSDAF